MLFLTLMPWLAGVQVLWTTNAIGSRRDEAGVCLNVFVGELQRDVQGDGIDGRGRKEKQRLSQPYLTGTEFLQPVRVQREQLAAIFRLMKEKSDTFGEMSEGDMKEQLRLYDI
ncbi:hypothetical protein DV515_00009993 [Chloebia gouldiae]|uniref:Matrix-remodeling-associated protein 7 helical domain-containing protein n=1 Tax=Chloebia gouldiae TaxID=44316 RepID=A0A3L8SBY9_CHLGU|nr:hypothetical protein DV515_00009993 [Chloebia gouldiae]